MQTLFNFGVPAKNDIVKTAGEMKTKRARRCRRKLDKDALTIAR